MRLPRLPRLPGLPTPAALCLTAAAALLPTPAHAAAPSCAASGDRAFPVTTRIHGGPDSYEAGGGYGTWYLDLTNTTTRTCANIHPVIVLTDDERALEPTQPRLEFYEGAGTGAGTNTGTGAGTGTDPEQDDARPHPVRFERTDADELVGVLVDERAGFPGFTVGPGKTLTVKVRLALTSDALPNEVTANAAVVQRRDGDGEWVGQSDDYRFAIGTEPAPRPTPGASGTGTAPPADRLPFVERAEELARTGLGPAGGALAGVAALILVAAGALLVARRRR